MRPDDAHRLVQAMERRLLAARRLVEGPVDGALAHEYIAAVQGEQEARDALLGARLAPTPRSASPSERA